MKIFAQLFRTMMIYIFVLLLSVSVPLSVMAEEAGTVLPETAPTSQPSTTYSYDASTGRWNTNLWYYDSSTGTYQPIPQPEPVVEPVASSSTGTDNPITDQSSIVPSPVTPTIISPETDNNLVLDQQNSATTISADNQTDATNIINSQAQTGDATVILNTIAADATSGNASDTATILNNVNSVLSIADNQKAASFTTDVLGDVNGDIILKPMLLKAMLESGPTDPASAVANVTNESTLTNDINLSAKTGNAGVIGNTTAGDATSGSANTVANVVNIINSMIAANQSFVGTVNIYGNLNGDILIAPDFIPQLIASNGNAFDREKETSTVSVINSKDMQSIINNVSLAAESGKAAVLNNTTAGDATTGDANTNVVIFNLSGHDIIASNSLLVFINVLGKWVGVIVDAPAGATAAAIGNGIKTDANIPPDLTLVSTNTNQIVNNIKLLSQSGNATVAGNTTAGNATSGNATASANIANMTGSRFGLSGWFGILFINVFGSWYGSFGLNTAYGDPVVEVDYSQSPNRVVEFIPAVTSQKDSNITVVSANSDGQYSATNSQNQSDDGTVLGSMSSNDKGPRLTSTKRSVSNNVNLPLLVISVFLIIISAFGINRFRSAS